MTRPADAYVADTDEHVRALGGRICDLPGATLDGLAELYTERYDDAYAERYVDPPSRSRRTRW